MSLTARRLSHIASKRTRKSPKRALALPDLELAKSADGRMQHLASRRRLHKRSGWGWRAHRPERRLDTNVEFYTALLLHGLGLPSELFTSTFAVGRVVGWSAHCLE